MRSGCHAGRHDGEIVGGSISLTLVDGKRCATLSPSGLPLRPSCAYTGTRRERGPIRTMVRLLGVDPGLRFTGWGVIEVDGNRLRHVADGVIATDSATSVPERLKVLHDALAALLATHGPHEAAVEETYVNRNGSATLKLGYARGVALLAPALAGIPVTEYGAKSVKLAVVGTGGAEKEQVQMMVRRLLPGAAIRRADAADALAVAICHAHHRASRLAWLAGARRA
jgi:crossover junction endodeoxyribonuclease RuvC